jgi:NAD-dependent dihydropyrimidine dehydrogenase PreA subunit
VTDVAAELARREDVELTIVDDLCSLVMDDDYQFNADHVVACFPRAVRWLLARNPDAIPLSEDAIHDLRSSSAKEIMSELGSALKSQPRDTASNVAGCVPKNNGWFPVLDYDRCNHCAQCLSFCLFEVFSRNDDGKIIVENPENCKDNCPACARICPEIAIVFPKAPEGPINGDEIRDELMEREKARIALEQSGTVDFRDVLKNRKKKSLLKPEARKRLTDESE